MMTRRKKILIFLPLLILLCGIGGFLFVSSDYFLENYIKDRLIVAIQEQFTQNFEISLGELKGNILTGVVMNNLSLKEKKHRKIICFFLRQSNIQV